VRAGPSSRLLTGLAQPDWVRSVFTWSGVWLLIRLALVSAYLVGGLTKLSDFPAAVAEQAHFGLSPPQLWAVFAIFVELGGSVLILLERLVWLAAGGLAVLTVIASLVAEPFWTMHGHPRTVAMNGMLEHLGLVAAFAMLTWIATTRIPIAHRSAHELPLESPP
jgi:uncharacterized membrane protein YphA (DoxX/SURF4 family)